MDIQKEAIVISGISGRFPKSGNLQEFWENVINGVDMTTDQNRWNSELFDCPARMGLLANLDKFDAESFAVTPIMAEAMEPRLRFLLELTSEAFMDAGKNPQQNPKTGVFVGSSGEEALEYWKRENNTGGDAYAALSNMASMLANRVSFTFNLLGPSITIDTACSSSLIALHQAFLSIRFGLCEHAIVGGVNTCLSLGMSKMFLSAGVLSNSGACKVFDASGDGFVRAEAAVVVLICKRSEALRAYAELVHGKINSDGYKSKGITNPSSRIQEKLLQEVYSEAGLSPGDVNYLEAHGTGTKVGDPQELKAIVNVFCKERNRSVNPLLIGSVKSNMGHAEAASGLVSIAKLVLVSQHGLIPKNLHLTTLVPDIPALQDGRLQVVVENRQFKGGLVAVSGYGIGGSNCHFVLRLLPQVTPLSASAQNIPMIYPFSGRTAQIATSLEQISRTRSPELAHLLQCLAKSHIGGHRVRGYALSPHPAQEPTIRTEEFLSENQGRPLVFIFSGVGSQYVGMVEHMMELNVFRKSIEKSEQVLKIHGFDLNGILNSQDDTTLVNILNAYSSITAIQVALLDLLCSIGVGVPDHICGHSLGEVAAAYADSCLTAEETLQVSFLRGEAYLKSVVQEGAMASVGLPVEEVIKILPSDLYIACDNSKTNVTVSGLKAAVESLVSKLELEGVFARIVPTAGIGFHCPLVKSAAQYMGKTLAVLLSSPKPRSNKWISTSLQPSQMNNKIGAFCSAEYWANNTTNPVRFREALELLPGNSIVVEIAPHFLLRSILKEIFTHTVTLIGLMRKGSGNNACNFVDALGQLFLAGRNLDFAALYEPVVLPVAPGTPMISPFVCWDHGETWRVPIETISTGPSSRKIKVDLNDESFAFLSDHNLNNLVIFPATGYFLLVWKQFAGDLGLNFKDCPVKLENVRFERSAQFSESQCLEFSVNILPSSGAFEICLEKETVCSGTIQLLETKSIDKESNFEFDPMVDFPTKKGEFLETEDFYKELAIQGFNYKGCFRSLEKIDLELERGEVKWGNNWEGYLDSMLQLLGPNEMRGLSLPIRCQKVFLNPLAHYKYLNNNSGSDNIPFEHLKQMKIVKSPGVEFWDIKYMMAPKQRQAQVPALYRSLWVPFLDHTEETYGLELIVQILLDNSASAELILVGFIENSNDVDEICLQTLGERLKPFCGITSYLTFKHSGMRNLADMKQLGIAVMSANESDAIARSANLVITKAGEFESAVPYVAPNGFLLVQKPDSNEEQFPEDGLVSKHVLVAQRPGWCLYRPARLLPPLEAEVTIEISDGLEWIEFLKQRLETSDLYLRIILWSKGPQSGIQGLVKCLLKEGYSQVRCFGIRDLSEELSFQSYGTELEAQLGLDLTFNIYKEGAWGCTTNVLYDDCQNKIGAPEAFLNVLHPGDLSSLEWIESHLVSTSGGEPKNLCDVHYSALNFRDVMLATGKLSKDALPGKLPTQDCVLGMEFAGILKRDERRVFGIKNGECLATSVDVSDSLCFWDVPPSWTMPEAATVPVAYATAYYALVVRGRLEAGETVLIHAGSGGVGQAAIAIALSKSCRILTTVSTEEKRKFLMERFPQLTSDCFSDSRNAKAFEQHVMTQTLGKGADLVLNSLAGPELEASIRCLASFGRFLEIGKVDLFRNANLGMAIFLKSIEFHGILLDHLTEGTPSKLLEVRSLVQEGIESGVVRPLPYELFPRDGVEDAFRFMAGSKHLGKVLIQIQSDDPLIPALPQTYFHPQKSYILLGGAGGIGMEVANWMVSRGARKLILVSRSGLTTGHQAYLLKTWTKKGAVVTFDTGDASTEDGARLILERAGNEGPIGGIFNLAAVLKDCLFKHQTAETFKIVSSAKIEATIHLDRLSRQLVPSLDYFVVFSSLTANVGNAGQTNYGLANSFMERICEERRADGLHGLAIQWGPVGDVGLWHKLHNGEEASMGTLEAQSIRSCLEVLNNLLKSPSAVVTSFVPRSKEKESNKSEVSLMELVARILGIRDVTKVNCKTPLAELGMDSLTTVQVKQTIEARLKDTLPTAVLNSLNFEKIQEMETKGKVEHTAGDELVGVLDLNQGLKLASLTQDPLIKLRSKGLRQGKNVFVLHALDGSATSLQTLMEELEVEVYGFECVKDAPLSSIPQLAAYYVSSLKRVQAEGPYTLLGYSFGAAVAMEMAMQLEKSGDSLEQLILLDGSHLTTPLICDTFTAYFGLESSGRAKWLLFFVFLHMLFNATEIKADILRLPTWEAQLERTIEMVRETFPAFSHNDVRQLVIRFADASTAACCYKPSARLNCKVTLLQASKSRYASKLGDDYGLASVTNGTVSVIQIPGKHLCFRDEPIELGIHKILNDILRTHVVSSLE